MSSFDSTKRSLPSILEDIVHGKIQLPDFQRGWVWDDERIRDLLASIARSFPVGAVMLMETGGDVRFEVRPVEGIDAGTVKGKEQSLILDGQQRLTTLTQAIALTSPVATRTSKGKAIKRHYYFDIETALEGPERIEDAILAVDETRQQRINFDRDILLDLSSRELECTQLYFPCDCIFNWAPWLQDLSKYNPGALNTFLQFQKSVLQTFNDYQLPVIELKKETSKEAVCVVFEKVNTGGVSLSTFELVTASYAAENYNLRDDWYGSNIRNISSRQKRLAEDPLLAGLEAKDFLQAVTLLYTHERKLADEKAGKTGKQIRPVSAKRASMLELPLEAYQQWADTLEKGFMQAGHFLRTQGLYNLRELPYSTQLIPLAAILTLLKERWREPVILEKLAQWFWCGVLGELYGGAVETRMANDIDELYVWCLTGSTAQPRTVADAFFQPERLYKLKSRLSAAYKAINVLILRSGARDFFWNMSVKELHDQGIDLDIHHIFPKKWCLDKGMKWDQFDHILNKTPISYKANRKIGAAAPSSYLEALQSDKQVNLDEQGMDKIVASHAIPVDALRADDFENFIKQREQKILELIYQAMGKASDSL